MDCRSKWLVRARLFSTSISPSHAAIATFFLIASQLATAGPISSRDPSPALSLAPSSPVASIEVAPQRVRLRWTAAARATHYRVFLQRSATESYRQVGKPLPAKTRRMNVALSAHLHDWSAAKYIVAACNLVGCARSSPVGTAEQASSARELIIPEYEEHEPTAGPINQMFGMQVALSGDGRTLAVADSWYFGGSEWPWYQSGAVYVYCRSNGEWKSTTKLQPPSPRGGDIFGSDLSLSHDGRTLAVGAQYEGYDAPSQDAGPGSVFVYSKTSKGWSSPAIVRATNPEDAASFGRSVELDASGRVLAVGAPYASTTAEGETSAQVGAVYVYRFRDAQWTPEASLQAPNPQQFDRFGLGVRLSEDGRTLGILAGEQNLETEDFDVGGWPNRNNTVYVFGREQGEWNLQAEFEGSATEPMLGGVGYDYEGQVEGFDLSADGRTLVIASPYAEASDGGFGLIRFYRRQKGYWSSSEILTSTIADRAYLGTRVTLSADGKTLAVTAGRHDDLYGEPFVVSFARRSGRWVEASVLNSPLYPDYSTFGQSIALSARGTRLAVGSGVFNAESTWWGAAIVY